MLAKSMVFTKKVLSVIASYTAEFGVLNHLWLNSSYRFFKKVGEAKLPYYSGTSNQVRALLLDGAYQKNIFPQGLQNTLFT